MYDYIFIDSGSPDSYLAGELGSFVNDTLLLNGTANGTDLAGNGTAAGLDEPLADVIAMAVTSLILGLMILVTVIGECRQCFLSLHLFIINHHLERTHHHHLLIR